MPRFAMILLTLTVALSSVPAASAIAADADELARAANTAIRQSENAFFKGDIAEASRLIAEGKRQLDALEAAAPDHGQLKNLRNKYERLLERIEKKQATSPPAPAGGPGASPASDLSSGARSTLEKAERDLSDAEGQLEQARGFLASGALERCRISIANATADLTEADAMLDRAERSFRLTADHPAASTTFARRKTLGADAEALAARLAERKEASAAAAADAAAATASLDARWLPEVESFVSYDSPSFISGPSINDAQALAAQDAVVAKAEALLVAYDAAAAADAASDQLRSAVQRLRSRVEVYRNDRGTDLRNKREYIEGDLATWERSLAGNAQWREGDGSSPFIVRPGQIDHLEELIADLATVAPADAAALTTRLAAVVASNDEWTARRQAWESRPRPFPAAGMTSRDLEATMVALLEDRGWNVERLVITDGDWWVQRGEFRYLATAALSGDDQGPFWSAVSFRQDATLAGYGPLHIWKVGDKVRLP